MKAASKAKAETSQGSDVCSCYDRPGGMKAVSLLCPVHGLDGLQRRIKEARGLLQVSLKWLPNNDWNGNPYKRIRQWLVDNPEGSP